MAYKFTGHRPAYSNELYHEGVVGMHWGQKNGPPYPLDRQTHNKVVKQGREERKADKSTAKNRVAASKSGSSRVENEKNAIMKEMNSRFGNSERNKAALEDLKNILKTTKGTYNKEYGISTYITPYGIFDVHYGPNGKIYNVSFDD